MARMFKFCRTPETSGSSRINFKPPAIEAAEATIAAWVPLRCCVSSLTLDGQQTSCCVAADGAGAVARVHIIPRSPIVIAQAVGRTGRRKRWCCCDGSSPSYSMSCASGTVSRVALTARTEGTELDDLLDTTFTHIQVRQHDRGLDISCKSNAPSSASGIHLGVAASLRGADHQYTRLLDLSAAGGASGRVVRPTQSHFAVVRGMRDVLTQREGVDVYLSTSDDCGDPSTHTLLDGHAQRRPAPARSAPMPSTPATRNEPAYTHARPTAPRAFAHAVTTSR